MPLPYPRHPDFGPDKETYAGWSDEERRAHWSRRLEEDQAPPDSPDAWTPRERELLRFGVRQYIAARQAQEISCEEYTRLLVRRARRLRAMNQWTYRCYELFDKAIESAIQLDRKVTAAGSVEAIAPLYGLPVPMKGTAAVVDYPSGGGCGLLTQFTPVKNSAMTDAIISQNGIIFGTTNVPPFAYSTVTRNAHSGFCRNPWAPVKLSSGGSSGGAASAVAAFCCPVAVSEDTGGSTRIPALCCGLFGFDPARNHYPNAGNPGITLVKDQIGAVARSLEDLILWDRLLMGNRHGARELHDHLEVEAECVIPSTESLAGLKEERGVKRKREKDEEGYARKLRIGFPKFPFVECPRLPKSWRGLPAVGETDLEDQPKWVLHPALRAKYDAVKAAICKSSDLEVVDEEWPSWVAGVCSSSSKLDSASGPAAGTEKVVNSNNNPLNAFVHALYRPRVVNGKPASRIGNFDSCMGGNVMVWAHEYLGISGVSLKDIMADCEGSFGMANMATDETQLRYFLGPYLKELVEVYNAYFDLHRVDYIVLPAGFKPIPDLVDSNFSMYMHHFIYPCKELHIPKLLVPTGSIRVSSSDGAASVPSGGVAVERPTGIQVWGRAVGYEDMFEDAVSTCSSVKFLHGVRRVVESIHTDETLRRSEAPFVHAIFADR